ncbi:MULTISPECIES: 2-oxo-4-hydroxy-4-carboxy-5-ureidoimidazoline decarboxylase [unclassified Microbacterium]|uniref:2-oxo-4-hydroxy-4-carboxy-5-ureidoimidazoline decarboxylase n=1 Tax=unclassified Microbacterium TaxID=2609290 RepID=UPI0012F99028|nr:2-oxo-4-hydroxy-4-carboxy-5-ureidoimidazoline decarboxylase [Microbacterium sp. MAH-37]MVQ43809.1 2-oxo-4-hydroxy-4-carboxy-5-ureidoimidazoline decarboxylase [Microbacterium sp. MAH-37]
MSLEEFNALPREDAVSIVKPALDVARWIDAIVDSRPFGSVDEITAAAAVVAAPLSEAEIDGALAHHPRIGEQPKGATAEAAHSRNEQAGVDASAAAALAEGNRAYEAKFDRVYLVRAAGRSADDILALLQTRLGNTPEQELAVIDQQLREIAALRLVAAIETEGARA